MLINILSILNSREPKLLVTDITVFSNVNAHSQH